MKVYLPKMKLVSMLIMLGLTVSCTSIPIQKQHIVIAKYEGKNYYFTIKTLRSCLELAGLDLNHDSKADELQCFGPDGDLKFMYKPINGYLLKSWQQRYNVEFFNIHDLESDDWSYVAQFNADNGVSAYGSRMIGSDAVNFYKQRGDAHTQNGQVNALSGIGYLLKSFGNGFNKGSANNSYATPLSGYTPPSQKYSVTSSGYKSTYGNTYQYDLSNPMDRIKYKTDPGAQLRDRITPNPYKDIETNINQYGGGVYPTDNSLKWTPVE